VEIQVPGAKKNEAKSIDCALEIPSILPNTNERFCRVVQVTYFLEIECVIAGCHTNSEIRFPIVIGSVGFGNSNGYNPPPEIVPAGEFTPLMPQAPVYPSDPGMGYPQPVPMYPPQPGNVYPPQSVPSFVPSAPSFTDSPSNDLRKFKNIFNFRKNY
jgi:hypothetical protein